MTITARHYANEPEALDTYTDIHLRVERDEDDEGEEIVRIDAIEGDPDDDQYPLGNPGISLELPLDEALALALKIQRLIEGGITIHDPAEYDRRCWLWSNGWAMSRDAEDREVLAGYMADPDEQRRECQTLRGTASCIVHGAPR